MTDVKFGTSGLRGLADELLAGGAVRYAAAFFHMLTEADSAPSRPKVMVGQDKRPTSSALAEQVLSVAKDCGFEALDAGLVPTPALAYTAQELGASAIMVTGSHIPADRNGLKFYDFAGEITKQHETAIARIAKSSEYSQKSKNVPVFGVGGHAVANSDEKPTRLETIILDSWHKRYAGLLPPGAFSRLRIGLLVGSSVAASPLKRLLESYGATIHAFGKDIQFAPVDTEAVDQKLLSDCAHKIAAHDLNCIVSTDPDGDRPLVIDELGNVIRGDLLGWITALWLDADHIATTVNANSAIRTGEGRTVTRTRIGSPFVIEAVASSNGNLSVGFEPNGGFLLGGRAYVENSELLPLVTRDSFLPILAALRRMAAGERLVTMAKVHGFNFALSDRIPEINRDAAAKLIAALSADEIARKGFFDRYGHIQEIDAIDGLRVLVTAPGTHGQSLLAKQTVQIIHLRLSGNAPELRIYVEAPDREAAQILIDDLKAQIGLIVGQEPSHSN